MKMKHAHEEEEAMVESGCMREEEDALGKWGLAL